MVGSAGQRAGEGIYTQGLLALVGACWGGNAWLVRKLVARTGAGDPPYLGPLALPRHQRQALVGLGPVPARRGWKSHPAPAKTNRAPGGCLGLGTPPPPPRHPGLASGSSQDLLSGTVLPRSSPALEFCDSRIPGTWQAYLSTPTILGFCPNTHLSPGAHPSVHSLCTLGLSPPLPGPQPSTQQQSLQALGSLTACRTPSSRALLEPSPFVNHPECGPRWTCRQVLGNTHTHTYMCKYAISHQQLCTCRHMHTRCSHTQLHTPGHHFLSLDFEPQLPPHPSPSWSADGRP